MNELSVKLKDIDVIFGNKDVLKIDELDAAVDDSFNFELLSRLHVPDNTNLSEETRVSLALMFVRPSNIIILDEPTNFIDLDTIEALETFIRVYRGTIILTSHDKYFVERTSDLVYEIRNGKLNRME